MRNPLRAGLWWVAVALARFDLVDRERAERTTDLSWPRIVTGFARMSQQAADLAMIGIAVGPTAIAGIGFVTPYWWLAVGMATGIVGGTISMVSQRFGAERYDEIDLVVKQSVWTVTLLAVPFLIVFWTFPEFLLAQLGNDPAVIAHGATYMRILTIGLLFRFLNIVASRTLVGADDAWTEMMVRAVGAIANIAFNAIFIFGLGMGVAGAALGTVLATVLVTVTFAWGFFGGSVPSVGEFPVHLTTRRPFLDVGLTRQLLTIATPLIFSSVARTAVQFPLLAIVAHFGPVVVAAYVISRRVRGLMGAPGWGFGLSSSSLVGQELGRGDEGSAEAYAWDIIRFAIAVYLLIAVTVFVFAQPVSRVFVSDLETLPLVTVFVRIATVSVVWSGLNRVTVGPLRASGDTRWPLYAKLIGLYGFTLPIAYVGTVTPLGIQALYLALIVETFVPATITYYRFRSGRWKVVSRTFRPEPTD